MSTKYYGLVCVTDLLNAVNSRHSSCFKHENGKVYAKTNIYINDEVDRFGNKLAALLRSSADKKGNEPKVYIGNFKESDGEGEIRNGDVPTISADFGDNQTSIAPSDITEPVDGLPF